MLLFQTAISTQATARTNCDADAMVVRSARPEFPEILRRPGQPLAWVVRVRVNLDAHGRVQRAAVWTSDGETTQNHEIVRLALNAEAIKAAKAATYRPRVVHCKAVASAYVYQITFTGGP